MNLNSIPAFDDNYIWVLNDEAGRCLIVDPGDAEPVLNAIAANNWQPEAIFSHPPSPRSRWRRKRTGEKVSANCGVWSTRDTR